MNRAIVVSAALLTLGACASATDPNKKSGGKETVPGAYGAIVQSPTPPEKQAPQEKRPSRNQAAQTIPQPASAAPSPIASQPATRAEQPGPTQAALRVGDIRVTAWIELLEGDGSSGTPVPVDRVFHSGERVRFHFHSGAAGFLSVLQFDPDGTAVALYPPTGASSSEGRLPPDAERVIPAPPSWLRFDQVPGTERLVFVFSQEASNREQVLASNDVRSLGMEAPGVVGARGAKGIHLENPRDPRASPDIVATGAEGVPMVFSVTLRHE